jgi:glycerophosphoryl diester phosphodiesterase
MHTYFPFGATCLLLAMLMAINERSVPAGTPAAARKQLVAHRGASAYAPEHTVDSYRLALDQGADFVEQDLAVTKDGVLVCIHDLSLERTTNVEEVFPARFSRHEGSVGPVRRWLVGDFTLAEIKRLDAGSWFDPKFAGARVPTFQEAIDLVRGKAGLYPELKDPAFYRERGISPEELLAAVVRKSGLANDPSTPLVIQSFDEPTIRLVSTALPNVPRVWLVGESEASRLDAAEKLQEIASWATGIGPQKAIIAARPEVVAWAHAARLTVTPWTFRSSGPGTAASVRAEMAKYLYEYDVDALFTDNPDQFPRK